MFGNPIPAEPVGQDAYGQPINSNPYGQPSQANPYGQPVNSDPYAQTSQANAYSQPVNSDPYAQSTQTNAYSQSQTNAYSQPQQSAYQNQGTYNSTQNYNTPNYYADTQPEDGKATGGLVCSILSLIICCLGVILAPVGMVLSRQAINAGNTSGKAKAGWIIGIVGLVLNVLLIIGYIALIVFGIANS